jgi:hypothetical protein
VNILSKLALVIASVSAVLSVIAFATTFGWHSSDAANWLSGVGSIGAAGAALVIATRDRRERARERASSDRAQAELVQVQVPHIRGRSFTVEVRNYGDRAVLDVEFDSATYAYRPESKADVATNGPCPVLDADRSAYKLFVDFIDAETKSVLPGQFDEAYSTYQGPIRPEPEDVTAWVRFRDAEGTRWRRGNRGSVEQLPPAQNYAAEPPH